MMTLPVGSIIPYGGKIDDASKKALQSSGWLFCDGSLLPVAEPANQALYNVIGFNFGGSVDKSHFNLPDLRGRFVRGTDRRGKYDPQYDKRQASNPNGNINNTVGSLQDYATAQPIESFVLKQDGKHHHPAPHLPKDRGETAAAIPGSTHTVEAAGDDATKQTSTGGKHTHQFQGGDAETRPQNIYVNWLIRYQDSP